MSTKFEQLLDLLVNEEMDKANELFHEIVVEKSRDIYENLIAEEAEEDENKEMEEAAEEADESVDEAEEEQDESVDEGVDEEADESMDLEDSYEMEEGDDEEPEAGGMEKTGDFGADVGAADSEEPEGEAGAIMDIKSAIAELEAAFAELEQAKGMGGDNSFGSDDMGDKPAFGADGEDETDEMMGFAEGRRMTREYVEKVGNDWDKSGSMKSPAPVGSGKGDLAGQTSVDSGKSPISSGKGKPTTGATAGNIAQGATGEGAMDGTKPNGKTGGLVKNPQDMKTGNGNVPGGSMGVKNLSKVTQNSKSSGPVGSGTGDKAGQTGGADSAKSPLNGAPNRNA
jgi:hypothetical protein